MFEIIDRLAIDLRRSRGSMSASGWLHRLRSGSNWNTGVANFQSDLETLFITFEDGNRNRADLVSQRGETELSI
jgi:hypothetical protein